VRKSHSLRSSTPLFKPSFQQPAPLANSIPYPLMASTNSNPYAQPFRGVAHSHSSVNSNSTNRENHKLKNKAKKKSGIPTSSSAANLSSMSSGPPPIPEPDYSLSESEGDVESEGEGGGRGEGLAVPQDVVVAMAETSGNSNASGSSSSSGTLPHSFSVEEIQKVRTQLKSSKSYPNDFLVLNPNTGEDGDNSSSGVSSDQDVPVGPPSGFDDGRSSEGSGGSAPDEKGVQGPDLQKQGSMMTLPLGRHRAALSGGILTRNAVSLAQLPPPMEGEGEAEGELVVPPPPEFLGASSNGSGGPEEVLAPPPQFSDNRLVTRVHIMGAVPKAQGGDSQLHSH